VFPHFQALQDTILQVAETCKDGKEVGEWSEIIEVEVPKVKPAPATATERQILASGHDGKNGWVQNLMGNQREEELEEVERQIIEKLKAEFVL